MISCWLAVAFLRANAHAPRDRFIAGVTRGPFVHTEIILGKDTGGVPAADTRAYSAFEGVSGFTPSKSSIQWRNDVSSDWTVLKFQLPPGGYEKAYAVILQVLAMDLPYNSRDLWQCCIRCCLPFEEDLDCEQPDTWKARGGVFCSQVALLLLRRVARMGLIRPPDVTRERIEETNSRGCSPNDLFRILSKDP